MSDDLKTIHNILNKNNLPLFGICGYEQLVSFLLPCRAAARLPKNAKSVIVVLFPYYLGEEAYEGANLSRYACVRDYHEVSAEFFNRAISELCKTFPEESFEFFADNSPVPEVRAACLAGLGVRGENGLLITPEYGSWVFIGEIVTSLELPQTGDGEIHSCLKCGKCRSYCPAEAIGKNGADNALCLSDITQRKGELTEAQKQLIISSGCAWGCDVCQRICPMNKNAKITEIPEFLNSVSVKAEAGGSLDGKAYAWRGKKVIERNLDFLQSGTKNG